MRTATDPWAGNSMRQVCAGAAVRAAQTLHRPGDANVERDVPPTLVGARIGANKVQAPQQSPP